MSTMSGTGILGGVMTLLALLSLTLASGAKDGVFYGTAIGMFIFCIVFIFYLINRTVGR